MNKCKWFGHKWEPVFYKTAFSRVIFAYCQRCCLGHQEALDFQNKYRNLSNEKTECFTHEIKYFKE